MSAGSSEEEHKALIDVLRRFDTCSVCNAIEAFDVRLRNEGFTDGSLHCRFPSAPPMVGHAVTMRIKGGVPSADGRPFEDRTDWWAFLAKVPAPRVVVIQDIDRRPGLASFVGEIHARIMASLGCVGVITNGAVRDLGRLGDARFQMYSSTLSVSHAYAHIVDFGGEVEVAGLRIMPGDLLHGDRHGVIVVPPAIAQKIPEVIRRNEEQENRIVEYCGSQDFTLEGLRRRVSWRD
ncbi:MAG: hypothetical protein RLZZ356_834 [Verrucomicrobiota bacterium]|jgi:4-hydroxy-4-methyl-2-oxoglutarate aldolase